MRISSPVSLIDFAPTLLHVLDLPGKANFLSQVTGTNRFRTDLVHEEIRVLGQTSPRQSESGAIGYSLRAGRWKLLARADGETQLFDLSKDPFELTDVASENPRPLDKLSGELEGILQDQRSEPRTAEANEEVQRDLRALGYGGEEK